ncbi:MAG: M56 family metallopeptidase [Flavobacterium sp.]
MIINQPINWIMTPILIYILKVNGLLVVVYLFYKLFLQKETYVRANRMYFLVGMVLSFVLPLLTYTKVKTVEYEMVKEASGQPVDASMPMETGAYILSSDEANAPIDANLLTILSEQNLSIGDTPIEVKSIESKPNDKIVEASMLQKSDQTTVDYYTLGSNIFIVMTILSLLWLVYKVQKLMRYIYRLPSSVLDNNIRLDNSTQDAYSFMRWIVLPKHYAQIDQLDVVLAHERIHVREWHSMDLIIIECLKHLFWFNPVLYFLQKEVNLNLEYIVDEQITQGEDVYAYQKVLVMYESNKLGYTQMVNTFGSSDLKKRVLMLNNPKSTNMKRLKYLLLSPVIGGFFFLFQIDVQAQYVKKDTDVLSQDVPNVPLPPEAPEPMPSDLIKEMNDVSKEAKRLEEEASRLGKEAKKADKKSKEIEAILCRVSVPVVNHDVPLFVVDGKVVKDLQGISSDMVESIVVLKGEGARAIYGNRAEKGAVVVKMKNNIKDVPYLVNGIAYTYNEFTALGNPVSSIANMDMLDAETATKRYGEVGKNGAVVVTLKSKTDFVNRGSFMDGAPRTSLNDGTVSYGVKLVDKEGNVLENEIYKSRQEADRALNDKLKEKKEAMAKSRVAAQDRSEGKLQEASAKREKSIADAKKKKDEIYKAQMKVLDDARRRGDKNLVDNALMYVEGKELSMDKAGEYKDQVKSVRIYTNTDAKAKLGYTGEYKVMELILKTEEDRENEKKVAEITKKYKAQIADRFNEVKNEEFSGLLLVNNVEKSSAELKSINSADIVTMEVYKGNSAIEKYGEKAKGGVIFIRTK